MECSLCNVKRNKQRDFDLVTLNVETGLVTATQPANESPEKVYHACGVCYLLAKELLENKGPQVDQVKVQAIYQYVEGRASIFLDNTFKSCEGVEVSEKAQELAKRLLSKFYNSSTNNTTTPRALTKSEMIQIRDAFLQEGKSQSMLDYVGTKTVVGLGIFGILSYFAYKMLGGTSDDENQGKGPARTVHLPSHGFLEKV